MLAVMKSFVPRRYDENELIYAELDDILEMTFVIKGKYHVGYEINKKKKYVVSLGEGNIIGEYHVLFAQKNMHIIKCAEEIFGYAISRRSWNEIQEEFEYFTENLKKKCFKTANR